MEFSNVIEQRQSVRRFQDQDVPDEDIVKLMAAASKAPSGKNVQNWHFVVVKNRELMDKIGDTIIAKNEAIACQMDKIDEEKGLRFRKFCKNFTMFYKNAPVLLVVYTTIYYPSGYHEFKFIDTPQVEIDKLFKRDPGMQSLGAALENLSLAAVDLGYGTCWMTGQNYAADEIEALLKKEVGFEKEGYFLGCMMALGVPEGTPKSPQHKPASEIYTMVK